MKIIFYKTTSEYNRIEKVLVDPLEVEGKLRNEVDIINPTIELTTNVLGYNYCFIPELNRYYFINNVSIRYTGYYIVNLTLDPLYTYKTELLTTIVVALQGESGNRYQEGFIKETDIRETMEKKEFTSPFSKTGSIILVATYGERG